MTFAHVFDICVAFALALFVVRGATRGLTGEIISFLGLIASVFCGWRFAHPMGAVVINYFPTWSPVLTELASAVVIFMCVSLAFAVVSKIMKALVKTANLKFLDHAMGAISGCVRTFVILLFIYGIVTIFPIIPGEWMKDSVAMKGISTVWPTVHKVMTDNGWIESNRITPKIEALPVYLQSQPASADM